MPNKLAKQNHAGRPGKEFFFPSFPDNPNLCPVNTLKAYIERTKINRGPKNGLFITAVGKHNVATSATIARWIKTGLSKVGIDATISSKHTLFEVLKHQLQLMHGSP